MKFGILDQSPIEIGGSSSDALKQSVHLAKTAESLGYERFWVSEHHGSEQLAGTSPEVLMSYLLAHTNTIRVGSGGVMLQHYSPYKVAENFNVLDALAPGRVDVGVGKAPGGLPITTQALQIEQQEEKKQSFDKKLSLLHQYFDERSSLRAEPYRSTPPPVYVLGASVESAQLAARTGSSFVFAGFINQSRELLKAAVNAYRELSKTGLVILALPIYVGESDEEATAETNDLWHYRVIFDDGSKVTVTSREQAELFGSQEKRPFRIEADKLPIIAGSALTVQQTLEEITSDVGIDELIFHTPIRNFRKRIRSYEQLSRLFEKEEVE